MYFDVLPDVNISSPMSYILSSIGRAMKAVNHFATELRKVHGSSPIMVLGFMLLLWMPILFMPFTKRHSQDEALFQESLHQFQVLDLGTRGPPFTHSPSVSLSGEVASNKTENPSHEIVDEGAPWFWELEQVHGRVSELCPGGDPGSNEIKMLLLTRPSLNRTSQNIEKLESNSSEAIQDGFFFSCSQAQNVFDKIKDSQPQQITGKILMHSKVANDNNTSRKKGWNVLSTPVESSKFRLKLILGSLSASLLFGLALFRVRWSRNTYRLSKISNAEKHLGVPKKADEASRKTPLMSSNELYPKSESLKKVSASMSNEELVHMGVNKEVSLYNWEKLLGDPYRAVDIRRQVVSKRNSRSSGSLDQVAMPYMNYDYQRVLGACCENVIGYTPVPTGVAGPLSIDRNSYFVPMATTEGVLVASTNRGCTAINAGSGVTTSVTDDGMTRAPCVRFPSLERASAAKLWLDSKDGFSLVEKAFNSTSRFARLQNIKSVVVGSDIFIRFKAHTGDAMGMNMISKGVEHALDVLTENGFQDMETISISGNYCTDKKPSAVNWIEGRGKSVNAQATIPEEQLKKILKIDVDSLVEMNTSKNLVGSAVAGSIGGFNAHAANIVTAVFLATGQDPAQNIESSNCLTMMKNVGGSLQISVTMPSIEVGTVGGGTNLEAQGAMLDMLGLRGANKSIPGKNSQDLARIVAATVLAGELSLCSSLAAGSLVKGHMAYNRNTDLAKKQN